MKLYSEWKFRENFENFPNLNLIIYDQYKMNLQIDLLSKSGKSC